MLLAGPGTVAAGRREQGQVRVADDRDARLGLQVHPVDVLAEVELAERRRGRAGVGRVGRAKLGRVPVRPGVPELVDPGRVAAGAVEGVRGVARSRGGRPGPLRERPQRVAAVHAGPDDVRLVVEDEHVLGDTVLGVRSGLVHLDRPDIEELLAVYLVHRQERRRKPAGAHEELAAGGPEPLGCLVGQFLDPVFDMLLVIGLRVRHVLAVGDHPGRNRGNKRLGLRRCDPPLLRVAQPRILFAAVRGAA